MDFIFFINKHPSWTAIAQSIRTLIPHWLPQQEWVPGRYICACIWHFSSSWPQQTTSSSLCATEFSSACSGKAGGWSLRKEMLKILFPAEKRPPRAAAMAPTWPEFRKRLDDALRSMVWFSSVPLWSQELDAHLCESLPTQYTLWLCFMFQRSLY